ncbi:MAG: glucose-6-phosphate isomerase [Rhodospirillaceae bacterium]|nr:glucose-6-phosphate isomerase [Rhodospirillaceae bacterium]
MTNKTYGPKTLAWGKLEKKASLLSSTNIASLFVGDPGREKTFSREVEGFYFDFSKQHFDAECLTYLLSLAEQTNVETGIKDLLSGKHVNNTEDRPAMHTALRRPVHTELLINKKNIMPSVKREHEKMRLIIDKLHSGQLKGYTGQTITDVVNIGIGGSYIGPLMTTEALFEYKTTDVKVHFVSSVGGAELSNVLDHIDADKTLFVVCSKSFETPETLINAQVARDWLYSVGGNSAIEAQFVGVSSNSSAMDRFGIVAENRLFLWDWVGGRYSIWSSIGFTLALTIGWERFEDFLSGGREMDEHFLMTPMDENLPVLLALIGVWNRNFLNISNHAILPYHDRLKFLPAYLQQLEMESNGKSIRRNGDLVQCDTCPIIWGELGTNAQHSFYQLLHQGTERTSIDFFLPVFSDVTTSKHHDIVKANCLAQIWALAEGDSKNHSAAAHQHCSGNRPSSLLIFEKLDPKTLGKLIALYEHKVYVQGIIWDVNSFDQWGVELGKFLATDMQRILSQDQLDDSSPALQQVIAKLRQWKA